MQVEWRKAVRERSYKLAHDQRRHQRLDGEQLKKRLFFEVISTDSVIGRLKRERTQMEERLTRYNSERAKIKSQHLLRQMDTGGGDVEAAGDGGGDMGTSRRSQQPAVSFEIVVHAPSEAGEADAEPEPPPPPPVFVSKLPGRGGGVDGGGDGGSTGRRSIASADGQLFELTESEDDLLSDFLERQQLLSEETTVAAVASAAASPRVLINGLSLEQFMKKCRSRHMMDTAIERVETFVDEWQATEGVGGGGVGGGGGPVSGHQRRRRTAGRRMPLEEPKDAPAAAAAAADEAAAAGQQVMELEKLERDFKSLLQEAKKARYLRGRNPEILERERDLTLDEIFQSAKPI